jgi:CHAT domain-containing protein/tetratricopeptide (TPR) repeat protein
LVATIAALAAGQSAAFAVDVFPLPPGGVERALPQGAVHAYPLDLQTDEHIHLRAEQRGVDVELRLRNPAGKLLLRIDSPSGDRGAEDLFFVAVQPGRYQAELTAFPGSAGRYRLTCARRPATPEDRRRAGALAAFSHGRELEDTGDAAAAVAAYGQAVALCPECRAEPAQLEARRRAARLLRASAPAKALRLFQDNLAVYRRNGDLRNRLVMQTEIARCLLDAGDADGARAAGREALDGWRAIGDTEGIVNSLQNLGEAARWQGDLQAALSFYEEELRRASKAEDRSRALNALGVTLSAAGDSDAAIARFQAALAETRGRGDSANLAIVLTQLGNALYDAGRLAQARTKLLLAWQILKAKTGSGQERAVTLASLARVSFALGDWQQAGELNRKALQLFASAGRYADAAVVRSNLGWIAEAQGRSREALERFQSVLPEAHRRGDRELEVAVLLGMARAERRRNNPIASRARLEQALEVIEAIRGGLVRQDLQMAFFAKREDWYGATIDLLMEQHRRHATSDGDLRAFAVSERSRARSLLDRIAGGKPAVPLSLAEVSRLLDDDTILLEYYLSEPKSYLWVVSSTSTASFELAGRGTLERQAQWALKILSQPGAKPTLVKIRLEDLGKSLLGPLRGQLGDKRLVFVPHGALQTVPFAALADPDVTSKGWTPLVLRHEIAVVGSASLLAALRQRAAARKGSPDGLALVASPVLEALDTRLPPAARAAVGPLDGGPLRPLPFVDQEADALLKLAPGKVRRLLGFQANRDEVTSVALGDADVVHFATHGLFDEEHPERSALVLSRFDPAGGLRRGLLQAPDIETMRLRARLVVLSACETARGREIRGEGVVGLTRSFFAAGADRVLVSLWKVEDRATAVLMERFYQNLWTRKRTPAAALREAQLSMLREAQWSRPYEWAGFLLQGSWD